MAETALPKHYRRNFWSLVGDYCFFGIGMAFMGQNTVIPGFLTALGGSSVLIGLVSSLQRAGWLLPQLVAARYLGDKPRKKRYVIWPAATGRLLLLLLALLLWVTGGRPSWLLLSITVVAITAFWIGDGLASVPWFDLLSKVIPPRRRGRLSSFGQASSGILGFTVGAIVEWMLGAQGPAFPGNYVYLFLLAFAMLALSLGSFAITVEEQGEIVRKNPSWREFIPQLWDVLKRDRPFRRYIITRQLFGLGALASPFYMTYALQVLGLPAHVAGRYTSFGVVGSILAAVILGWLNERHGSKRVIQASIALTTAVPVLALTLPHLLKDPTWLAWGYGLVFLGYNASMSSMISGWMNYVLELAPDAERPTYVGLTNTLNGVTTLFSTVGGLILQWTNDNYSALFLITVGGLLVVWPLPFGLPEPRHASQVSDPSAP